MSGLAAGIARTQWVDHHCKADLVDFHHWQGAFDTMLGAGLSAKGGPMSLLSQGYCAEGCSDWSGRYQPYRFKLELAAELPSLHRCSPADESTLSRCPENRQQATQIKRNQSDNKKTGRDAWRERGCENEENRVMAVPV